MFKPSKELTEIEGTMRSCIAQQVLNLAVIGAEVMRVIKPEMDKKLRSIISVWYIQDSKPFDYSELLITCDELPLNNGRSRRVQCHDLRPSFAQEISLCSSNH